MNSKSKIFSKWLSEKFNNCWDLPGLSIVVFNENDILFKKSYGYSNVKTKRRMKLTDKFCIASCGKSILCLAIMLAIKKKDIPDIWNMKLGDIFDNIHKDYRKCLVKYIANHTSGISDFFNNCPKKKKKLEKYKDMEGTKSRRLVTNLILKMKPFYKPNSKFEYSNIGYGILGHIVEKLTNMKYNDFIDKYVFELLGIEARHEKYHCGKGFADGHFKFWQFKNTDFKPLKKNQHYNPAFEHPAGCTFINPIDFAKYAQQYLINGKKSNLIDKSILNKMTKINKDGYAFGLDMRNNDVIKHKGGYFFTTCRFDIYTKKNIGFVVYTNCEFLRQTKGIRKKIEEIYL